MHVSACVCARKAGEAKDRALLLWSRRAGWCDIQPDGVDPSVKDTGLVAVVERPG